MCSLCGVLGAEDHWSEAAARPAAFAGRAERLTRTRERRERAGLASRMLRPLGLTLVEWQGQYLLRSPTGRTEIVPHLAGMGAAIERLAGRPCDPLDPALLAALEKA
jgi:hypothetical protein